MAEAEPRKYLLIEPTDVIAAMRTSGKREPTPENPTLCTLVKINSTATIQAGFDAFSLAQKLSGIGGEIESVVIVTQIRLRRDDDVDVVFRGDYAALADLEALDMSVLGRDILGLFAVIADRPGDAVALIRDRHCYAIEFD